MKRRDARENDGGKRNTCEWSVRDGLRMAVVLAGIPRPAESPFVTIEVDRATREGS
jgi:hypothetical protein